MVDEKYLVYRDWMPGQAGYRRSMAFFVERRHKSRAASGGDVKQDELIGVSADDVDLQDMASYRGSAFALRSALTGRYVRPGGILDWGCLLVTADKPEEAAVFAFVPLAHAAAAPPPAVEAPAAEGAAAPAAADPSAYHFGLRLVSENKMLKLRHDGYIHAASVTGIAAADMAASVEVLRPRQYYEIKVPEKHIGLLVSKDLPLRVVGFNTSNKSTEPGPAERTGRVRIGDVISTVDGLPLTGVPRNEALAIIATCRRPVTLGFTVSHEPSSR